MKVFIGKYSKWWGPYQIANLLQKVGVSEDRCDKLGDWLADTQLSTFCEWTDSKRNHTIKVRIDDYDTWSMDSTLAYIILPMLKQLKETMNGAPNVDDEDVPKELRSTSSFFGDNENEYHFDLYDEWDIDDNWHDRWGWVMGEMIWAFSQVNGDWEGKYHKEDGDKKPVIDTTGLKAHNKRMQNGFRLFGKYYQNLWD